MTHPWRRLRFTWLHLLAILVLVVLVTGCAGLAPLAPAATAAPASAASEEAATTLPAGFDVQGHRGARGLKPENTLPAFETALDLGVTTLELDLHFTADQVVVIWHDPRIESSKCGLDPNANIAAPDPDGLIKQGAKLAISQLTWAQVQAYRCDRNPNPGTYPEQNNEPTELAGARYGIARLSDLFDFVAQYAAAGEKSAEQRANAGRVRFNIETKRDPDSNRSIGDDFDGEHPGAFELDILRLIDEWQVAERVVLQSFDHRSLWAVHSVSPDMALAALTRRGEARLEHYAGQGAAIWSPNYNNLTPALVDRAHENDLAVIPWTVNDPNDMRDLIEWGVDGIISDRPDLLLEFE